MPELYTVALLKPDATHSGNVGAILTRIERCGGLRIDGMKLGPPWSLHTSRLFYKEHIDRPYFDALATFMASGPVVALLLGANAGRVLDVASMWRAMIGPYDRALQKVGEIRFDLQDTTSPLTHNLVHGSDSPAAANRERQVLNFCSRL